MNRIRVGCTLVTGTLVLSVPAIAIAQTPSMFAAGSIMLSMQGQVVPPGGGGNPSVPTRGIGGNAVGVTGAVGGFLNPHIGVGVEVSIPQRFHADQMAAKYRTRNAHRDAIVSGIAYTGPSSGSWQAVGGVGWVRETTQQEISYANLLGGGYGPFAAFTTIVRDTLAMTGGIDVSLHLTSVIALSSGVRVHWVLRDTASLNFLGLSPVVFRAAIGIRSVF